MNKLKIKDQRLFDFMESVKSKGYYLDIVDIYLLIDIYDMYFSANSVNGEVADQINIMFTNLYGVYKKKLLSRK